MRLSLGDIREGFRVLKVMKVLKVLRVLRVLTGACAMQGRVLPCIA
jgi:hypothetical protein